MTATLEAALPAGLVVDEAHGEDDAYAAAVFNAERTHRYLLTRIWDRSTPPAVWVMLNPSTADALADDPTIRRVTGFSGAAGAGGFLVVNLFALRSTDPRALRHRPDAVGAHNETFLRHAARAGSPVIAAWGAGGALRDRAREVTALLRQARIPLLCLGVTSTGQPKHPLYLAGSTPLTPYDQEQEAA